MKKYHYLSQAMIEKNKLNYNDSSTVLFSPTNIFFIILFSNYHLLLLLVTQNHFLQANFDTA